MVGTSRDDAKYLLDGALKRRGVNNILFPACRKVTYYNTHYPYYHYYNDEVIVERKVN